MLITTCICWGRSGLNSWLWLCLLRRNCHLILNIHLPPPPPNRHTHRPNNPFSLLLPVTVLLPFHFKEDTTLHYKDEKLIQHVCIPYDKTFIFIPTLGNLSLYCLQQGVLIFFQLLELASLVNISISEYRRVEYRMVEESVCFFYGTQFKLMGLLSTRKGASYSGLCHCL